jgi:hypothetical protein
MKPKKNGMLKAKNNLGCNFSIFTNKIINISIKLIGVISKNHSECSVDIIPKIPEIVNNQSRKTDK